MGGLSLFYLTVIMNKQVYEDLPTDLRHIVEELFHYWFHWYIQQNDYGEQIFTHLLEERGASVIIWSDEEKERVTREVKMPQWDKYPERMEKLYGRGEEATEMVAYYKELNDRFASGDLKLANKIPLGLESWVPWAPDIYDDEAWLEVVGPAGTDIGKLGPGGTLGLGFEYYPGVKFQRFSYLDK